METTSTAAAVLEKKSNLEEELRRVERQIYELEGEYLQETVKDGNILRGWESYLGKQASSGAIRRINRFREADRMFSASSVTSGQASTFSGTAAAASTKGPAGAAAGGAKVKKAAGGGAGGRIPSCYEAAPEVGARSERWGDIDAFSQLNGGQSRSPLHRSSI